VNISVQEKSKSEEEEGEVESKNYYVSKKGVVGKSWGGGGDRPSRET